MAAPRPREARTAVPVLVVLLVAATVLGLAVGTRVIPFGDVVRVMLRPDGSDTATIVIDRRLPRTLLALLAGAALGIAGALTQGHTRNPLADPGLLGVQAGASFAVVVGIVGLGVESLTGYVWLALAGAGVTAVVVFVLGTPRGGTDPLSLVLAGAAVSALLLALAHGLMLHDSEGLSAYRIWVVGSVTGRGSGVLGDVLPFLLAGAVLAAPSARGLNILQLGDDVARSLGVSPARHKILGIGAVTVLTGAATAACGPIGFIGLVVPHMARFLGGSDHRRVVLYSGLLGALLLTLADVAGRVIARPAEVEVGIVTALVGGPVFVLLVRRTRVLPP